MFASEPLTASLEDYLEAIFVIVARKQAVRAKDIARHLNVKNASVTRVAALAERGLINYAPYDVITLTPSGTMPPPASFAGMRPCVIFW